MPGCGVTVPNASFERKERESALFELNPAENGGVEEKNAGEVGVSDNDGLAPGVPATASAEFGGVSEEDRDIGQAEDGGVSDEE